MTERKCENCGCDFTTTSDQARFCKELECKRERSRLRRRKADGKNVVPFTPAEEPESPMLAATRADLGDAAGSSAGSLALQLARRLDGSDKDTGSSYAALSREYRAALADAMKDVKTADDPVAVLRRANEERRLSLVR